MALLETRGVAKTYRDDGRSLTVLQDVGLTVERGEFVTIFGASGSGKSTLLHILGGLDRPTQGDVLFEQASLYTRREPELAQFRNRQVGFVFQFYHLLPECSAVENVMLPCTIGGMRRAKASMRAREMLEAVGLSHRLTHRPRELSGGEQQRVAIARALAQEPPLLLADEPTGNLDEASGAQVIALLRGLWTTRQMTVVMVTHNPDLIRGAQRRLELRGGRVHAMG